MLNGWEMCSTTINMAVYLEKNWHFLVEVGVGRVAACELYSAVVEKGYLKLDKKL